MATVGLSEPPVPATLTLLPDNMLDGGVVPDRRKCVQLSDFMAPLWKLFDLYLGKIISCPEGTGAVCREGGCSKERPGELTQVGRRLTEFYSRTYKR